MGYAWEHRADALTLAINPRLAAAISAGGQYARLDMHAIRSLGNAAVLIYQRLSAWIDPGRAMPVRVDTLVCYVWPGPTTAELRRQHRGRVRAAMRQIGALAGWTIEAEGDLYRVARAPVPGRALAVPLPDTPRTGCDLSVTPPSIRRTLDECSSKGFREGFEV